MASYDQLRDIGFTSSMGLLTGSQTFAAVGAVINTKLDLTGQNAAILGLGTPASFDGHISNAYLNISANATSAPTTLTLFADGVATGLVINIAAATVGKLNSGATVGRFKRGQLLTWQLGPSVVGGSIVVYAGSYQVTCSAGGYGFM